VATHQHSVEFNTRWPHINTVWNLTLGGHTSTQCGI